MSFFLAKKKRLLCILFSTYILFFLFIYVQVHHEMEVLHRAGLTVDKFPVPTSKNWEGGAFLTHAHSDSLRAGTVPERIICHRIVGNDLRLVVKTALSIKECVFFSPMWVKGEAVIPFPTDHCCGSTGFWFPGVGVLYTGDGRITPEVKAAVTHVLRTWPPTVGPQAIHIVEDGLFRDFPHVKFPPLREMAQFLKDLAHHLPFSFVCLHSSHMHFLAKYMREWVPLSADCRRWRKPELSVAASRLGDGGGTHNVGAHTVTAVCPEPGRGPPAEEFQVLEKRADAVASTTRPGLRVLGSALWFCVYDRDPGLVYWHAGTNTLRVCLSFHADFAETSSLHKLVREQLPAGTNVVTSVCPTRS